MERGAWRAIVQEVTKSLTQLNNKHFHLFFLVASQCSIRFCCTTCESAICMAVSHPSRASFPPSKYLFYKNLVDNASFEASALWNVVLFFLFAFFLHEEGGGR